MFRIWERGSQIWGWVFDVFGVAGKYHGLVLGFRVYDSGPTCDHSLGGNAIANAARSDGKLALGLVSASAWKPPVSSKVFQAFLNVLNLSERCCLRKQPRADHRQDNTIFFHRSPPALWVFVQTPSALNGDCSELTFSHTNSFQLFHVPVPVRAKPLNPNSTCAILALERCSLGTGHSRECAKKPMKRGLGFQGCGPPIRNGGWASTARSACPELRILRSSR